MAELSPEQAAALGLWVDQQAAGRERLSVNLAGFIRRLFRSLMGQGMYDEVAVGRVAREVAAMVRQGQVATGDLTSAYFDQVFANMGIRSQGRVTLPERLRGVDPAEQWQRPAREYRRHVKDGLSELDAMARAEERAETMARTDLTLAMREASRQRLVSADSITGYRRVIHPERSKSGTTCGLCIAASDRVYRKSELLPIHDFCNCETLPITGALDPGRTINDQDIAELYRQALVASGGDTGRAALKRVRFAIVEHGELGPQLVVQGQRRRTARDARRDSRAA